MDITQASVFAVALAGFLAPLVTQAVKAAIPSGKTEVVGVLISLVLGVVAIAATGGFSSGYSWAALLPAVVGVSQVVYALFNWSSGGSLAKTEAEKK